MLNPALNQASAPYSSGLARRPDDHPLFAALADAAAESLTPVGTIYVWREGEAMSIACVTFALFAGTDEFAIAGYQVDRFGKVALRKYGIVDHHASGPVFRHYEPVPDQPTLTIHDLFRVAGIEPCSP